MKTRVAANEAIVTEHEIEYAASGDCPDDEAEDELWDLDQFKQRFKVNIVSWAPDHLEVDLIHMNCAIGNAFRRILISETETMAVEKVRLRNNTSLLQDEFLAHRLGLIPIRADPRIFDWHSSSAGTTTGRPSDATGETDDPKSSLIFSLKVRCVKKKSKIPPTDGFTEVTDGRVVSKHITWVPLPEQEHLLTPEDVRPRVVHEDILVAKLNKGQELDLDLLVVKGIGQDHAKFSPVATASYRLLPRIQILDRSLTHDQSQRLVKSFSPGVLTLGPDGRSVTVTNPRIDQNSRNWTRHEDLKDVVRYSLLKDHLIFSIESTGSRDPDELMLESMEKLSLKCQKFLSLIPSLK